MLLKASRRPQPFSNLPFFIFTLARYFPINFFNLAYGCDGEIPLLCSPIYVCTTLTRFFFLWLGKFSAFGDFLCRLFILSTRLSMHVTGRHLHDFCCRLFLSFLLFFGPVWIEAKVNKFSWFLVFVLLDWVLYSGVLHHAAPSLFACHTWLLKGHWVELKGIHVAERTYHFKYGNRSFYGECVSYEGEKRTLYSSSHGSLNYFLSLIRYFRGYSSFNQTKRYKTFSF